jgi:hypothetical protein
LNPWYCSQYENIIAFRYYAVLHLQPGRETSSSP